MFDDIVKFFLPKEKIVPAKDTTISGRGNMHTIHHWHEDSYMDADGNVYKVKKVEFNNKRQARFKEIK